MQPQRALILACSPSFDDRRLKRGLTLDALCGCAAPPRLVSFLLETNMALEARCSTTAMAIMPHTDAEEALQLALSLDIPFWPQLPRLSFYEDMYVQASEHFPGIVVDLEKGTLVFDTERFYGELPDYSRRMGDAETFTLSRGYSAAYHEFLRRDLRGYPAVRGQVTGPISLGFNVLDEARKPIIYNDEVRVLLFDFIQQKVNVQYRQLKQKNSNAFVWVDEPALNFVFSGLSGYNDLQAKQDYRGFLQGFEGPTALHLCPNVNLPYLLELGVDILSFDAYQLEFMPREYATAVAPFIAGGRVVSWGIVPTESVALSQETPETLAARLCDYWDTVSGVAGIEGRQIAEQSLVAPARCCVRDMEAAGGACGVTSAEESNVRKAFGFLKQIRVILRERYGV
ncbi:MAG: hypothetical protein ACOC58_04745 [Chloroflexota bacterium]